VLGCGVALVFFILIELILMAAGVKSLYERTDPAVGFAGYAPLFLKHAQPNGALLIDVKSKKTIDISAFSSGTYILQIQIEDKIYSTKILKK